MFNKLATMLVLTAAACCAHAATQQQPVPQLIQTINGEKPIRLQSLRISGDISGGMAQTKVRMVFFNPNSRQLEGNLQFPLLAGQQISGFALDMNGEMRPAVTVEKAKGRQVFEDVERRKVDPALLEVTQGNNFKLRVYPVAALGTRTVELTYTEALPRDGARWAYKLPLAYGDRPQDFDLTLKVHGGSAPPRAIGTLGAVNFTRSQDGYQARVTRGRYAPQGALTVLLPANAQPQTYVQERDGVNYFVAELPVSVQRTRRAAPKVLGLLWDSSGSGANRNLDAEMIELERFFKTVGNVEVRLTRLRDTAEPVEVFKIANGKWDALQGALEATVYDGASALGDWKPQADVDEYLLVSDGLLNYGSLRFPTLGANQRLYAMNSSLVADTGRLAALAQRNGGRLVQVEPRKPGAAADALLMEGPHVRELRASGASEVFVDSSDPQGLLRIAGKLDSPTAQLTLTLVQQGRARDIVLPVSVNAPAHPLAAYLWAAYKLRDLEAEFDANKAAIRRLGAQFSIPTHETSLIVLDRVEDYARYDIAPPPSLMAAWEGLMKQRAVALVQRREKHLDGVVREFNQKVAWWEKTYPKGEPPKPEPAPPRPTNVPMPTGAAPAPTMAMPPPPAPPATPMAEAQAAQAARADAASSQRASGNANAKAEAAAPSGPAEVRITMKKWTPDAPYFARLNNASPGTVYAIYIDERPSYATTSAFYLDVADILLEKGRRDLALRVLSNLAELDLENRHVLRILGYRLLQAGAPELAIPVFEKVQGMAEEEPQSFRDLGLAYAAAGQPQKAVDQLGEVVMRAWGDRFAEIELIALAELNAIVATAPAGVTLDTSRVDARLLKNLPLDLRAVLTWDADNSDMDLWVTDPNGEKCFYSHRFTYQGGRMSRDFTGGYGPEEFSLRNAKPGKYKIEADFYGSRQQVVAGATTVQVRLSSGFGASGAKEQMITLRLTGKGNTVLVGEFEVK